MGMWLFLFTELILFGGLFIIYAVYRFVHQQEFHLAAQELNTTLGLINTIALLTSSMTAATVHHRYPAIRGQALRHMGIEGIGKIERT